MEIVVLLACWLIALLVVQVAVILVAANAAGRLFRRLRQPAVVGEMIAGIVLGPSVFGATAPRVFAALFPTASMPRLSADSQAAVFVYMFLVGMDMDGRLVPLVGGGLLSSPG